MLPKLNEPVRRRLGGKVRLDKQNHEQFVALLSLDLHIRMNKMFKPNVIIKICIIFICFKVNELIIPS